MRLRRPFVFSLLIACSFALGHSTVDAAPNGRRATPKVKGVGPKVFTKLGVPAMRASDAVKVDTMPTTVAIDPSGSTWTVPVVPPFEGQLELTARTPFASNVGIWAYRSEVQTVGTKGYPPGYHFVGVGQHGIGVSMPITAAGDSDLLVSCEGQLPPKLRVILGYDFESGGVGHWALMELQNVTTKAKFVAVLDAPIASPKSVVTVSLWPDNEYTTAWHVDRCTVERV